MFDISVIIPVYNVSDTIERCARSLFSQTKDNIEFIFINDFTPDNSIEILNSTILDYPHLKNSIIIIHLEKNSGQGTARKIGLAQARGKYIAFCDSDDWVETNCYEKLYVSAVEKRSDIVVCDYFEEYKKKTVIHNEKTISTNPSRAICDSYKQYFKLYLWNKLIKKDILTENNIELDDGINIWEDELYLVQVFLNSKCLSQVHLPLYHYNKANIKSTTRTIKNSYLPQLYYVTEKLLHIYSRLDGFDKVSDFLEFRCRVIVVRNQYTDYELYKKIYPGSGKYIKEYDLSAFSLLGRVRIWLLNHGMVRTCIFLNKIRENI